MALFGSARDASLVRHVNRELINNGYIKNLLDIGVTGLTSNPTLFEKAISSSKLYDDDFVVHTFNKIFINCIYFKLSIF